jgi:hypothetical protein
MTGARRGPDGRDGVPDRLDEVPNGARRGARQGPDRVADGRIIYF